VQVMAVTRTSLLGISTAPLCFLAPPAATARGPGQLRRSSTRGGTGRAARPGSSVALPAPACPSPICLSPTHVAQNPRTRAAASHLRQGLPGDCPGKRRERWKTRALAEGACLQGAVGAPPLPRGHHISPTMLHSLPGLQSNWEPLARTFPGHSHSQRAGTLLSHNQS